jgi:nicotinate-nucleotide pyrophosphorylase (carboxylating)
MAIFESALVQRLVALALEEDLAFGDITTSLTVPQGDHASAALVARQDLVVCGLDLVSVIIREGRFDLSWNRNVDDGVQVAENQVLCEVRGSSQHLLAFERTTLNFLQRMSGVATFTRSYCEQAGSLHVLDTRKTLPGWRLLDKYSTRVGGARNHRASLGEMVLIKNNHIDAHSGGMRAALAAVVKNKPLYMPWEIEVRDLAELSIALEFKPDIVMLDNFSDELIADALGVISKCGHRPLVEVSGGVRRERLVRLAGVGVDAVSVGALTTQAPNVDISMRIRRS